MKNKLNKAYDLVKNCDNDQIYSRLFSLAKHSKSMAVYMFVEDLLEKNDLLFYSQLAFDILTNPLSYINGSAQLAAYHAIKIMSYISNNGKYEEYVSKLRLQYNFNQRTVP